jgi:hypothetical protein
MYRGSIPIAQGKFRGQDNRTALMETSDALTPYWSTFVGRSCSPRRLLSIVVAVPLPVLLLALLLVKYLLVLLLV